MSIHIRFPGIPEPRKASSREIIGRVGVWHGWSREDIVGPRRFRPLSAARADAVVAVKTAYPSLSLNAIGRIFGGRHHTTIMHLLRKRGM